MERSNYITRIPSIMFFIFLASIDQGRSYIEDKWLQIHLLQCNFLIKKFMLCSCYGFTKKMRYWCYGSRQILIRRWYQSKLIRVITWNINSWTTSFFSLEERHCFMSNKYLVINFYAKKENKRTYYRLDPFLSIFKIKESKLDDHIDVWFWFTL